MELNQYETYSQEVLNAFLISVLVGAGELQNLVLDVTSQYPRSSQGIRGSNM